jgi:FtsZ-interacting cell division protein ZipA
MASLRWILLLAGLLFIVGLALWERRRPRQARGAEQSEGGRSALPAEEPAAESSAALPVIAPGAPAPRAPRGFADPEAPLKVVELSAARRVEPEIPLDVPVLSPVQRVEPGIDEAALDAPAAAGRNEPRLETVGAAGAQPGAARPSLVVEWPPESERRIVNLRVVPVRVDRFPGRALRLSLTAAGFEHGRFGIFHLPGPGGRVVVSAASLTRPGLLDPDNMDFQRFGGLNLFAVLPGPLAPRVTVDRLVDAACDIAQRLEGRVQDENGMPLDVERVELLHRVATGEAASAP